MSPESRIGSHYLLIPRNPCGLDDEFDLEGAELTGLGVGPAFLLMGSISSSVWSIDVAGEADLPTVGADLHSVGNAVSRSTPCRKN